MSKPAIEVKGISKTYVINHQSKAEYSTLKDDFGQMLRKPFSRGKKMEQEQFRALNDVSFEVKQGEIFGIIGRNGSGKSTLLKILSRIVDPTEGSIILRGKTASLLEVGTGFHPELTGRENVYLNGSMLGMSRQQIKQKFQDIIDFSEIENFIDTPVKFYSSGMYVRLAFAVAAHLDPDILILDEVLAVGDASFQKKSMNKILSIMNDGKTVLFVSHSMGSVRQLCSEGILLEHGQITYSGNVDGLIEKYTLDNDNKILSQRNEKVGSWENDGQVKDDYFTPDRVFVTDSVGKKIHSDLHDNNDYWMNIEGSIKKTDPRLNIGYCVWDDEGRNLLYQTFNTDGAKGSLPTLKPGKVSFRAKLPKHLLSAGIYNIKIISSIYGKLWISDPDSSQIKFSLNILQGKRDSSFWTDTRGGIFAPMIEWEVTQQ